MKRLFFILLAAVILVACEDEKEDSGKALALTDDTQVSQTVYADQTNGANESIRFKAREAWYASVSELAARSDGSEIDWLALDAYSGGAGEYALTMTLKENYTGSDRKAEIKIVCGETVITISVEQKATTSSGEIPEIKPLVKRLVKRIVREPNESQPLSVLFEYADSAIAKTVTKEGNAVSNTSVFKVSSRNITETKTESTIGYTIGESLYIEEGSEAINNGGGLREFRYLYSDGYMSVEAISFRVGDVWISDSTVYRWENGKLKCGWDVYTDDDNILKHEYKMEEPYICKANVSIYRMLTSGYEDFRVLDYFGKNPDYLIGEISSGGDKWNKDNGVRKFRYEKDYDGYVVKIYERWTPVGGAEGAEFLLYEIEYY